MQKIKQKKTKIKIILNFSWNCLSSSLFGDPERTLFGSGSFFSIMRLYLKFPVKSSSVFFPIYLSDYLLRQFLSKKNFIFSLWSLLIFCVLRIVGSTPKLHEKNYTIACSNHKVWKTIKRVANFRPWSLRAVPRGSWLRSALESARCVVTIWNGGAKDRNYWWGAPLICSYSL